MPKNLSDHLLALRKFYSTYQRLPSYAEILALFHWRSKNSAYKFMQKLHAQKIVQQTANGTFAPTNKLTGVKILGSIAAGFPSPAEEELTDAINLDQYLISHPTSSFLVRVSGDSMIEAGIQPNDLVIVERQRQPRSGDIVIAYVDDAWTMKRFAIHNKKIVLLPANKKYKPIYPTTELKIEGVVVGVVRKYH
ncbi:MAG: hypothetical protein ACD_43C00088G0004 [uncultured bacterium]|nr:MAG: hypothetical protein ACD_43C00088G0004 [uncultured bacterium]